MASFLALFHRAPRAELVAPDPYSHAMATAARGTAVAARTAPPPAPAPQSDEALKPSKPNSIRTVIDATTDVDGGLKSGYSVMVDGRVNGPITVTGSGHAIIVRKSAHVSGALDAPMVMIAGTVHGDIRAQALRILKTAVIMGRVASERVSIEMGATIVSDGLTCKDDDAESSAEETSAPQELAAHDEPQRVSRAPVPALNVLPDGVTAFAEHPITPRLVARSAAAE
ncbi:MAG TPA: polymer-forming cytoskeletal protein [Nevskiaceae bacterium]|nr:polymer-forming cytoskeletal protein [Nevskiaceae bacterium]